MQARLVAIDGEYPSAGGPELKTATEDDLDGARPSQSGDSVYASPRLVNDLSDCHFYHTMEIPGHGVVAGEWDLREGIAAYLGNVDLRGKRVLEMGTASGFVCFHMEAQGADVVAYDLSEKQDWDVVPYARHDEIGYASDRKDVIRRLNNAFWLGHRAFRSHSKMVYGDVYSVPEEIGAVDVATFGSILLHLRDPFRALQKGLRLTRETVIITDMLEPHMAGGPDVSEPLKTQKDEAPRVERSARPHVGVLRSLAKWVAKTTPVLRDVQADRERLRIERDRLRVERDELLLMGGRYVGPPRPTPAQLKFLPDWSTSEPRETWWHFSPDIIRQFVGILGFEDTEVTYHTQQHRQGEMKLFTVVGHRTSGRPAPYL